jgi:hypothetical protein
MLFLFPLSNRILHLRRTAAPTETELQNEQSRMIRVAIANLRTIASDDMNEIDEWAGAS